VRGSLTSEEVDELMGAIRCDKIRGGGGLKYNPWSHRGKRTLKGRGGGQIREKQKESAANIQAGQRRSGP